MIDPIWISTCLSGLAAVLAAFAAFRPRAAGTDTHTVVAGAMDDLRRDLVALRRELSEDGRRGREEAGQQGRHLREEIEGRLDRTGEKLAGLFRHLGAGQGEKVDGIATRVDGLADTNERRLQAMKEAADESARALREELARQVHGFAELLGTRLDGSAASQKERLEGVEGTIRRLTQTNADAHEGLRKTVEGRLEFMRADNVAKLEEMRRTVDEKLQGTLEERLGEKFKLVSHHLEQVHRSVGEMQSLASGVDGLKRVLTNVKTRGTWAEVSLGALLDQVLAPEQYGQNVETVPGSGERVEYAVRFPGPEDGGTVWLPVDAKFPVEDYERLVEAAERGDGEGVERALRGLETRIKLEGQKICSKYLAAPHTTDFGIMYLPTEGLYAEVIRRPGLVDHLQGQCRIVVAGPTVLLAILNSLRMGFRTLAIQKRSSEIGQTLSAVKTEFGKYGVALDAVKKKLQEASNKIEDVGRRKRAIDRTLRGVDAMDEGDATRLLALDAPARDGDDFLDAAE